MLNLFNVKNKKNRKNKNDIHAQKESNILGKESTFLVNESYKAMRTNIMFSLYEGEGCKAIVFTSAVPGEGKTTVCINTAISFAQTGSKVLLIDADLRKPKVSIYLDLEDGAGLSDFLGGFTKNTDDIIRHIDDKGIDCIIAGNLPPNPAELLGSSNMKNLLSTLGETYDYIFIDAPPINIVTDAIVISKFCLGAIVVTREMYTSHDALKYALDTLKFANIKIFGFVVNGKSVKSPGGYHYNKKIYGYRYGYGYHSYDYGYEYSEDKKDKKDEE